MSSRSIRILAEAITTLSCTESTAAVAAVLR